MFRALLLFLALISTISTVELSEIKSFPLTVKQPNHQPNSEINLGGLYESNPGSKNNPESSETYYETLPEPESEKNELSWTSPKRAQTFVRFGKRTSNFVRYGNYSPKFIRLGQNQIK